MFSFPLFYEEIPVEVRIRGAIFTDIYNHLQNVRLTIILVKKL